MGVNNRVWSVVELRWWCGGGGKWEDGGGGEGLEAGIIGRQ